MDNTVPAAPIVLSASDVAGDNGGAIGLNWTVSASGDVTQQRIYRGTATGGPYGTLVTTISNNTTSTYTDNTGLVNGTTYYYVIRSYDGTQESVNSNESSAVPVNNPSNPPTGLSAADVAGDNGGAIALNWTVSSSGDVTQQRIYRGTATGGPYGTLVTTILNNTTFTYTDNTGLTNGTTYYYVIRAYDGTQESGNSNESSAAPVDNTAPAAPTVLSAADVAGDNGGAIALNWTVSASGDVTQQRIYRGTATGGPYGTLVTTISNNTTSTYTDNTGLINGTTYYYVIRAFDGTQESGNSNQASATPLDNTGPAAPTTLSAADVTGDNGGVIVLNWTPSASGDVTQQRIYRGTATGGPYGTLVTTISNNTTSTYTNNTGLTNGVTYYYVTRSYDGTQESGNSNEASAVPIGDIASPANSTITATSPVYADGVSLSTVTVTIRDITNNPVAGATVTLSSSRGATDTITQPSGTTNISGQITGTVKSSTAGNSVISVVANGTINLVNTATINFYNTPAGSNVVVSPISSAEVTFTTVTGVGTTAAQENPTGTPLSSGYITPTYYDISTTAGFTGTVSICITYNEAQYLGNESRVKLLHYETGAWVNRTSGPVDTINNKVCGNVTSFSEFATAEATVPTITTASLPDGTAGASYSATLTSSGGVPPLTWSILTGSLPAGLSLNASTGVISGTPTTAGTSNFTVRVTDSYSATNDKALSIMIYSAISITTISLADGTTGAAYSQTVSATGGKTPYNWSIVSGSLPAGLSLNTSTGVISGAPSATGTYNFTIQVQDANSAVATKALSIAIYAPLSITTIALADGTVSVVYSQALSSTGGKTPYTWSITSGSLPAGLTLNSGTGVIGGTPTATGVSNFTVQVTDANSQISSKALSITIYSGVAITTAALPDGTVGLTYNTTLTATGGATPYTWSITLGTLPTGLSLNSSSGVISGTPTTAGSYPITVQVTDNNLVTNTRNLSITIYSAISVATASLADGTVNATYSQTLTASGGKTPYTWSITAGTLPSGLSLNITTGVISGTPSLSGTSNFTVQVTDANGATATRALSITIFSAISITTISLSDGTVNLAYSQTVAASGGKTPYTWSIISGVLPAGLSLNSSTGAVTGTPTASGASTFTAQVTDANGATDTQALTITVYAAITITTATLPDGTVSANYSSTVNATGGKNPLIWGLSSGGLPTGLILNSSTGAITGAPTASGPYNFTIQVTDANGAVATQAYTVTIYASISISTTSLADGTVNASYSQTLTVSGGKSPFTWTLSGGTLPAGLTLAGGTGVISGTPTAAGTSNFTIQATDANGATASRALSITIYPALSITTNALSDGTVSLAYNQTLAASGGKSPLAWAITVGALPTGLGLAGGTGVISGTPTAAGTFNFTVQATDANGAVASKALSIVIYSAISVTTTSLADGTVGAAYSQTATATGGKTPYSWSIPSGSLPTGLSLNSGTGGISGTPTVAGTSNFTIRATDANGATADQALSIAIYNPLSVTTTALAAGTISLAYSQTLAAAGGKTPYSWSVIAGTLPTGLSLVGATGVISGIPTATGTWNFTAQATDAGGRTASQALSVTIYSGLTITTAALADGTVTAAYSATLSALGGQSPYTWAITVGSLPTGLSLNSGTGVISGTPTLAGSYPITVQVTDSNLSTQTKGFTITIYGVVSVTTAALSDGTVNAAYSQTLAASGGKTPYTWSITLGSLPTGLVLNGVTGVISGTPSASGTFNFTVQVTDANGAVATRALSILVYSTISVTTTALSDGTVSAAYSQTLAASGGKTPLAWAVATGILPAGLSLNGSTGVISGTPTMAGTSNFTMQVTDANGAVATRALSIVIYGAVSVTTASLPDGMVGSSYSQTLSAAGGKTPYSWSITLGTLPAGLSLNASTGIISGTPTAGGTSNFTVQVTDANGATATQALAVTVYATLTVTTSALPDGTVNLAYSTTLTATGGKSPLAWSITVGVLPAGLSLNASTGVISGLPTTASTSNITVRVTDANGFISDRSLSITVYSAISIGTASLADGTVNGSYSATLTAIGGKTPYIWSITLGTLPAGLTLNGSTGVISGTPTLAGTSNFTIQVTDANGATASQALSITIYSALSIGTASLSDGTVSLSYTQTLTASGGKTPYTWSITTGSLPAGLSLNTSTGVISGTPTTAGTSNFTVRVTDANNAFVDRALSITIYAALSITTTALSDGTVSLAYSQTLVSSGGKPPVTWAITVGSLPAGLSLNTSTGVISGTPTAGGTSNFTVRATDANGATSTQALAITIYAGLSITTSSLAQATVTVAYSQTLTAAGGKTPYTWSITLGTLPAGLTLNASTGVISGLPTAAGTSNFTVQVTDDNSATSTRALSIVVNAYPAITTTALSDGTVNLAYSQTLTSTGGALPVVWSITLGTLPTGLSLNASTGVISGTPTAAGTSNFTVRAADGNGATVDKALSITIYPAVSITTSALSDGTVNLAYSQTLAGSGGKTPYTWGILSGTLPAGLSLNTATGVISGTPPTAGTSNFTVQVTDANGATASRALAITIFGGVSVTTATLAEGNVGSVYSQTLAAAGGKTPYSWSITLGTLPAGLILTGSTGAISGTPTAAGTSNFTVQVTDDNGATATRALSITIYNTLTITTSTLSEGTVSASYTQTLAASGGKTPYTWSLASGILPAGLTLNSSTGEISGTPTTAGTYGFTVRVTDSNGFTNDRLLSINIYGAVSVTTSSLPDATINASYATTLAATGGKVPYVWSVIAGTFPDGLSFNVVTGDITGIPTVAGLFSFTVRVQDVHGATATRILSINVYGSLSVTTSSLADGTVNASYSASLSASGGKTPYTWSISTGVLPAGLTLAGSTGVISGTPTVAGTSNFTVQVTDSNGATASRALSITIYPALSITTNALSDGTVSLAYNQTLAASGGKSPLAWAITVGALPTGLGLAGGTGVISGTPTAAGTFNFTVQATDANGAVASKALSIVIYSAISVTTTSLADGTVGAAYSQTATATGGKTPYSWSIPSGSLPTGLSLNSGTGGISGTPTVAGTSNFTIRATDANGATADQALSIAIYNPLSVTTTALAAGTISLAYSQTLAAAGGKTPYSWSVIAGTLPTGLSLVGATGVISGIPTATGTWNFTAQATDAGGRTASQALSVTIYSGLTITTAALADGTVTAAYSATLSALGGQSPYTWAITVGSLPTGLSLNSGTGVISGTPTLAGSYPITVQVTDSNLSTQTKGFTITIYGVVSVTTAALSDGTVNAAYSQTLAASGGKTPYTWSITLGSLPTGLVLNGVTGVISGTPSASGTFNFTVQVTDANGAVATRALSILVYSTISVTTTALSDGTVSAAYSQTLAASGGKTPLAWAVATGILPAGLSLNGSTGVISGTPTMAGTSNFTMQVTDANGAVATRALSIVIYGAVSVTTASLPDGMVGSSYSQTLSAAGGKTPYSWSITLGTLPAGLSLNASTGIISGTPTAGGTSNFTVQVTDANGATATQALAVTVYATLTVTTSALPDGTVNLAYSTTLTATGGKSPLAWSITVGVLPAGLSLNASTGVISGLPTTASTSNITVRVTDANGFISDRSLSITVYSAISIGTASLADGTVNGSYSATLTAIGGKTPYIWSITLGTLPAGLTLNGSTGVISGTPTLAGTSNFTIQVTDANGATASQALSITIYSALSIGTASLSDGTVSLSYTQTLTASGGKTPYTWSITTGSLPAGLSLNTSTGVISGTPTTAGTSNFTVRVTDANNAFVDRALSITIYAALSITTTALSDGTVSLAYSQTLVSSGGKPPVTWAITVGSLPAGLSLNTSTGVISGTPTAGGTSNFTVRATDANGATSTQALAITIYAGLSITTSSLAQATVTVAYSQTLTAAGGKTPYTWSITLGTLPAGLTLNASTGVISGLPTAAGTSNFTVQVTDDNSATSTRALSIVVNAYPAITTTALSDGTVNLAYSQTLTSTGGALPVVWSITLGTLPTGLSLNASTGVISGTPTAAGTSNFTVRAADGNGATVDKALSITIYPAVSITTSALSDGTVNLAYSQTLAGSGGKTPITWAVTVGVLPAGLNLNSVTGEISGTPTAAGTSNFTVRATDANGAADTRALSITIYSALSVTTVSLTDGTVNLPYSQNVSASGGKTPYTWSIQTGTLPAGLSLNSASGAISGTPTAAGISNFTIRVTDANGATANQALVITVYAALTITTTALSDGTVSLAYSQTVVASGGKSPLTWGITAGVLPAGLSLNTSTGGISGTPTTAGTSNFTIQATDANGAVSTKTLSITIFSGLSVSTSSLSDGTANWAYSQTLVAGGGKSPYTWTIVLGTLPVGLSLTGGTGVISGTPAAAGTSNFTVQVTDDNGATATRILSITVYSALSLTTTALSDGTVSLSYSQTAVAAGGKTPYTWSIVTGTLPAGLSLNTSTGTISGTPTAAGVSNFTLRATDANGAQADRALTITVYAALSITTASLADGTVSLAYTQTLTSTGGKSPITWAITVGSLPSGLTLNSATGVISGIPDTSGTGNFTVMATDANGATASQSLSITIYAGLSITTTSLAAATETTAYSRTVSASGGKTPYAWAITLGILPAGLTLNNSTGVISGTPTATGTANFTVQVTDANGATDAKALSIVVNAYPAVTTASLGDGTVSLSYTQTLSASGGTLPVTWSIFAGVIPAGLSLNSSSGVISGLPTASGTSNFTVRVTDANGATADRLLSITIYPAISVTTSTLSDGTVNLAYSQTLTASGGKTPLAWSMSTGTLPAGLTLNSTTGVVSGTPTTAGTSNFTIQVTDSNGAAATKALAITIYTAVSITTATLPDGTAGLTYSQTLNSTGGKTPHTWSIVVGTLPAGLNLNSATGAISGTPSAAGTSNFTVRVTDANGATANQALSVTVYAALSVTTVSLADGTVSLAYSQTLTAIGGKPPLTWSISAGVLPLGLSLNGGTGVISGLPVNSGTSNFTVQVLDANGAVSTRSLSITIFGSLAVSTSSLPDGTANWAYNQTLSASGGKTPYTWIITLGSLPLGLSLNGATGVISGTPTTAGTGNFTVQVTDDNGATASQALSITIYTSLSITTSSLSDGTVNLAYSQTMTGSGGKSPYTWSLIAGTLPAGLSLNTSTGVISGTPTAAGTGNFTVQVTDANGAQVSRALSIVIYPVLVITTTSLADGTVNLAYSRTMASSGGKSPVAWSVTLGVLPAGLSLNGATGVISGTPTTSGTSNFTIQATDANGATATQTISITIYASLSITTTALQDGTVSFAYSQSLAAAGGKPPLSWAVTLGTLPLGLTLNSSTGVISGTPTTGGTSNFTVQATDANGAAATRVLSITIYSAITIVTASLNNGTVSASYSQTMTANGGKTPYTWSITAGALPAGLALNTSTGEISGTPTTAGTYNFTAQVMDSNGAPASVPLSIIIYQSLSVTTSSLSDGTVNLAYSQTLAVSGGGSPYAWSIIVGSLPAGLALNGSTGAISGMPTTAVTANFTVQVMDANSAVATRSLSITIYGALSISTPSLPAGTRTAAYSQTIAASGGKTPYAWSVTTGVLPAGLALNSATGQISGTPTLAGISNVTIQVSDANGATDSRAFSITINEIPLITTASLSGGTAGTPYSQTLTPSGGTSPLTWSLTLGSLPVGLTLNAATGIISGTPTLTGAYNFTITLTDSYSVSDSRPYSINIVPGVPARANISASKTTIVANGTDSAALTITVRDANDNLVADGTSVTVTTTNGTVTGISTTLNGVVSRTITGTFSGAAVLGVESPTGIVLSTVTGNTTLSFIPGPPAQANIAASKTTVIADGVDQTVLTITVRDANGNLVSDGTTVTLTTTLGTMTGSGNTLNGVVTRYLSSITTGTASLGVQSPTGTALASVSGNTSIMFAAGAPAKAVIAASATTLVANGVDSSTLIVTVYDANNNLVTDGTTVVVTTTLGTVTGIGTTVNGVVTRTITGTISGTAVLGVQSPTGTTLTNVTGNTTIVFNPGPPAQANITASKTTIIADGVDSTTLTVTVRDATGNLVTDGTTVQLTTNLGTVTGSGATASGVVTRSLSGTVSGTASLGVESPVGFVLASVTGNTAIILQPGLPAGTITLSPVPASIIANSVSTSTVTSGVIRDAYNNPVLDGTLITVATDRGSITTADASVVDPGIQVTTASGVTSFVVQSGTVIGTANITAVSVAGSASGSTQIAFIAGAPSAVNSTMTATTPVYTDGISASTVTITVRDANMNLVSGATVSLSSNRGLTDIITQPVGVTDAAGQIIGTVASTATGDTIISATINGTVTLSQTAGINFYNTKTGSNITVNPDSNTSVTFDMVITIGITSTTPSGTGPALPAGYILPVYVDISTTATFSGNITVCIAYNEATYGVREGLVKLLHDEAGVLVDRTTSVNTATNTVCASVSSFSIFALSVTTATQLQITTAPQTVAAGDVSGIVTVEAQDNFGVLDPGVSGTVDVTSNSATLKLDTSSTGLFAGNTLIVNIANGVGNFYFKDTASGTPTITVTDAGAILTPATQQETISPAVPSGIITLTPVPASIVADGVTTSTVTSGVITDVYGNTVSNGTLITVSTDRGTITTADADAGTPGIQVATGSGVISFVVRSGTVSGTANITAASVQGSASGSTQITFLPGVPSGTIALTPSPASMVADGLTTSTVTSGVITDAYGNTVLNGTLITVSTDRGTITTADADAGTPGIQVATGSGVISFVVQSGTVSGTANISAVSVQGSAGGSTQITFLPGLPSGAIALTPAPASIVADGFELSTVTSGVVTDFYGNTVLDGTLITVATDRGTITTADASGVYAGIQVATVNGVISFVVRSSTVSGTAVITAFSVQGSASGSTQIDFVPGAPYGTIALTPNPAILPADGAATSTVISGIISDVYNNTVSDGTLITVSATMGAITMADADAGTPGIQVSTTGGIITFTFLAGTTEGTASVSATSVQGSATGQAAITLTNVPPELNYPSETGYGSGDALEPNSGLRSTTYRYKIIYRDVNNNTPAFMRICIDTTPCTAMNLDTAAIDPALRDSNYSNGEQYVYTINTLTSGDHSYYFETTDGLAYTKTPPSGSLNGPHVNYPPVLSYSIDAGYVTDGVDPDNGNTNVTFNFKAVYTDLDNQAPSSIRVCIDAACYAMATDTSASASLMDGNYTNGEQYVYSSMLTDGTHNYYFDTSDSLEGALLPQSGSLSGPIVTNTYTPVGLNVVVRPDVNVTITFDQVTALGDTYVTNSQTGSSLPSGYLHGSPPAYFDIWTTASYVGKVRMCFTYNDQRYFGVGYGGERGLRWLHVEGGAFRDRTVTLDVNNDFVCGDVYSFSEFSAAVEEATLVTLTSFKATGMDSRVLLTWSTASEVDSMGFNILRGPTMTGPFTRINSWLVRSKGTPTKGMTYSFDDAGVENGVTYFYKLENVDVNGKISAHMIASATPSAPPDEAEAVPTTSPAEQEPDESTVKPQVSGTGDATAAVTPSIVVIESHPQPVSPVMDINKEEEVVTEEVGKDVTSSQYAPQERAHVSPKSVLKEPVKEEFPSPSEFSMKIEDDKGNELSVRQAREDDKVNEPFEAALDDNGKVVLKWLSAGKIKGFNVQRLDNKGKKPVKVNTIPMPFFASQSGDKGLLYTFRDNGVTDNTVYEYKVETISPDGSVTESKPVEISTKTPALPKQ